MDSISFLQILLTKGVGDAAIKRALKFFSENSGVSWDMLCSDTSIQKIIFNNKQGIYENISSQKENAQRISNELESNNVGIVFANDYLYPKKLKQVLGPKCPAFLFYKGNIELANKKSVGFCGSRKASLKGISITQECAFQLAENDIVIISGYAKGIDMAAHKAAVKNSGETAFILAEGILKSSIKKEIGEYLTDENHVFISQFLPESEWHAGNAMKRNSLIIGLSDAMILVESGETGGTFAAGNESLHLNQPLFVIDFAQPEVSAKANPFFISKGGIPIKGKKGIPNLSNLYKTINDKQKYNYNTLNSSMQLQLKFSDNSR